MARSSGGTWLVRLDDLDTPRQVPGMADDILATLEEFGLEWDGEVTRQSRNLDAYRAAFERLLGLGMVYPCGCSRREITLTASAPHPDDDCLAYPGTCRAGMRPGAVVRSWRVRVADEEICYDDLRRGRVCQNPALGCGDFALRRGDGEAIIVHEVARGEASAWLFERSRAGYSVDPKLFAGLWFLEHEAPA